MLKICIIGNIFQKTENGHTFPCYKKLKKNVQDGTPTILMRTGNHRQRMKEIGEWNVF